MVMGPAPPGTEVMAPATCDTSSAATSPTNLKRPVPGRLYADSVPSVSCVSAADSGTAFIPMSTTVAPGFTQSPLTSSAHPTAAITTSAPRTGISILSRVAALCDDGSSVRIFFKSSTARECTSVTDAAPASRRSHDMGMPTMLLSPSIATEHPLTGMFSLHSSSMQPSGAHGMKAGRHIPRVDSLAIFSGLNPSTSLRGSMHSKRRLSLRWGGTGSCRRIPCTFSSALSLRSTSNT
mmetsp:Transcript_27782/g.69645  ORF Transcript_27782/g.69645 Transcript_27782/m.69645 type:complete len:237 (+) Transcript_27782:550-1260(+)